MQRQHYRLCYSYNGIFRQYYDNAPLGDSRDTAPNDGIWATLGVGDFVEFQVSYPVTLADIDLLQ